MSEENQAASSTGATSDDERHRVREIANRADSKKPAEVSDREWRRARMDAGHMVVIRSHFKSIFLVPLALVSLICGVAVTMGSSSGLDGRISSASTGTSPGRRGVANREFGSMPRPT